MPKSKLLLWEAVCLCLGLMLMAGGMVAALTYIKDRTEENAASQKAFAANYEVKHAKAMQEVEGLKKTIQAHGLR